MYSEDVLREAVNNQMVGNKNVINKLNYSLNDGFFRIVASITYKNGFISDSELFYVSLSNYNYYKNFLRKEKIKKLLNQ